MGILDDAIREHLELKRSRGATDSELQRMEDEAFGPPTRPGEPDFPEADGAAEQAANGAGFPQAAEARAVEPEAPPEEPVPGEEEHSPIDEDHIAAEAVEDDEVDAEGETALYDQTGEPEQAPIESLDTVEHPMPEEDVDDEGGEEDAGEASGGEEDAGEDEDVLADTPEFLKDAPEDDELWFEQGKPKDFDF
jgi:hypothetical protein